MTNAVTACTVNFNQAGDASYLAAPLVINTTSAPITVLPLDGTQKGANMLKRAQIQ